MRCPYCGSVDTQVKDSRPAEEFVLHSAAPRLSDLRRPFHDL